MSCLPQRWLAKTPLLDPGCRLVGIAAIAFVLGCSSPLSDCSCGGTSDCLALCMCSGEAASQCERECGEAFPESSEQESAADDEERIETLRLLFNEARAAGGCCENECFRASGGLTEQAELRQAAASHAGDMAARGFISHETPEGLDAVTRIRRAGYEGCSVGENISVGDDDPAVVLDDFLSSYEHCLNVLEPRFSSVGTALARDTDGEAHWVVTFGGE